MGKTIVQKFGGSSLCSIERIKAVAQICLDTIQAEQCALLVVVSAMGDTTDNLLKMRTQITDQPSERESDILLSTGEQVSAALLSMAIQKLGHKALALTGWQAGIQTEAVHSKARICKVDTQFLKKLIRENWIPVIAGFQGIASGEITTLGRGGSDTTAVALAGALKAERCDIYTDVDSIYTTDPRLVNKASRLPSISYDEMLELASLGAQVLHPRSVETAKYFKIPLRVRSSWQPNDQGTLVVEKVKEMIEGQKTVRGVTLDRKQARLSIMKVPDCPGIAHQIFGELAEQNISVDVIVQCAGHDGLTEVDFTVAREEADLAKIKLDKIVSKLGAQETFLDKSVVKISVVGAGMINQPGIAGRMFKALGNKKINIQMISTSEIRISCIIQEAQAEDAIITIHEAFNLDTPPA